jgi:peptidoglycan hydrolase-like protein with peptidoglycan-binding domain
MVDRPAGAARRWYGVAVAVLVGAAVTACADSRDAAPDDTIPRITSDSTSTTAPQSTEARPATTAPSATTAVPTPLPTQATPPPTASPTHAQVPPTAPQVADFEPPTAPPTQPPGPTSTVVVTPGDPAICSADGIGADTGHLLISDVRCRGGWAIGRVDDCPQGVECESVDVFHVTEDGWVHDGLFAAVCAEALAESGMSIYTALAFNPAPCQGDPDPTEIIRPGSSGGRVTQLQIALVALGYDLLVDGRYGPRTQAAVRDFQGRNGLEVDGIAGPQTQAALGIGPGGAPATTTNTTAAGAPSSTAVVTAGEPVPCTADAIAGDIGRAVPDITACRGGWAIGREQCPAGAIDCRGVDVFHVTDEGWVHDGAFPADCVDDLTVAGMSVHTAAEFAELCADGLPQRENILPGTTGPEVEQVQIALVALGYPIAVDGTYGPRTEAAVRDLQAANDLEVDGIAGPDTQTALGL